MQVILAFTSGQDGCGRTEPVGGELWELNTEVWYNCRKCKNADTDCCAYAGMRQQTIFCPWLFYG